MSVKRVLVVDDEEPVLKLLEDALSREGFAVDLAANATEALSFVKQNLYDALLLDIVLPDMNGLKLHRQIRKMDDELAEHTLFMSGHPQSDNDLDYFDTSASGFLAKPFDIWEVKRKLVELTRDPDGAADPDS